MDKSVKITALTPDELATILSRSGRQAVSGQQVLGIAETAGILSSDGKINLIEYAAFLAKEISGGES